MWGFEIAEKKLNVCVKHYMLVAVYGNPPRGLCMQPVSLLKSIYDMAIKARQQLGHTSLAKLTAWHCLPSQTGSGSILLLACNERKMANIRKQVNASS
jgi:hypothetical protein